MDGYCNSDGTLNIKGTYGCRWSASPEDLNNARSFEFDEDGGKLCRHSRDGALPVRPVLK